MKILKITVFTLLLCAAQIGCRKDTAITENDQVPAQQAINLSVSDAQEWLKSQNQTITISRAGGDRMFNLSQLATTGKNARAVNLTNRNWVLIAVPGQPIVDGQPTGYRKLLLFRNKTGQINARILEIVPDARSVHREGTGFHKKFTGKVFIYNTTYQLIDGNIYAEGKMTGKIRPVSKEASVKQLQAIGSCEWEQNAYVDAVGEIQLVGQMVCSVYLYDDGFSNYDDWGSAGSEGPEVFEPTGGGSTYVPPVPEASNLPDASQPGVDAKKMMDCFGTLPNSGATLKMTVYVQEPFPGTTFNYGPNSVGHTAIGLTKTVNGQSITQIFGFYPENGKGDVYDGASKLVDNSGMKFNTSVSYEITEEGFHAAAGYISGPLPNYSIESFNCTAFAVVAASKAGVSLPSAWNTIGYSYSPGVPAPMAQCPAGLGNSIRQLPAGPNVNTSGGNIPMGNGPCN